jgi:anti-anti-sigma factor
MVVVVVFRGEYDLLCKLHLREELGRLAGAKSLVMDLTAVTFLDSTCIGEFFRFQGLRAEKGHRPFTFVRNSALLRRLFTIIRLEAVFPVVDSLDEALRKQAGPIAYHFLNPVQAARPEAADAEDDKIEGT